VVIGTSSNEHRKAIVGVEDSTTPQRDDVGFGGNLGELLTIGTQPDLIVLGTHHHVVFSRQKLIQKKESAEVWALMQWVFDKWEGGKFVVTFEDGFHFI
jgi:hypothetical protein